MNKSEARRIWASQSASATGLDLEGKLQRLQQCSHTGYEVKVIWRPDVIKNHNGRKLAEEVIGDTIFVYTRDKKEAVRLVAHGFGEWLLNKHSQPYREMINKLIELFELQQYQSKEKIVGVLERLFERDLSLMSPQALADKAGKDLNQDTHRARV